MSNPETEFPYNPYGSPELMAEALGLSLDEATSILAGWNFTRPTDPNEALQHANKASRYEHGMQGLNSDLHDGLITQAEYWVEEQKLRQEIYDGS